MCLEIIKETFEPDKQQSGIGYKTFRKIKDEKLYPRFFYSSQFLQDSKPLEINKWINAKDYTPSNICKDDLRYEAGFHIYLTEPESDFLYKVKYRKGRILGMDGGTETIVADEMFIMGDNQCA